MVTIEKFRELTFAFAGVSEYQHFDRRAFKSKKIFVTLHEESRNANFMLSINDQADFCGLMPGAIAPLPNKWGLQGVTSMQLDDVSEEIVMAALEVAYLRSMTVKKK
jgi:hypothetical protein